MFYSRNKNIFVQMLDEFKNLENKFCTYSDIVWTQGVSEFIPEHNGVIIRSTIKRTFCENKVEIRVVGTQTMRTYTLSMKL